jgi:Ca2+-binding RTX toxin-like protein
MTIYKGTAGDDSIVLIPTTDWFIQIWGYAGNDLLQGPADVTMEAYGGPGDDTIIGGGTNPYDEVSILGGGPGNDYLVSELEMDSTMSTYLRGGRGQDTMVGSRFSDTYYVDNRGDVVVEDWDDDPGFIWDEVRSLVSYRLGEHLEGLILTGNSAVKGFGNALVNGIHGNSVANFLAAGAGDDWLYGNGGADTLWGGIGADKLSGGAGDDIFSYRAVRESQLVHGVDFISLVAGDRIDLSRIDADVTTPEDDAFSFIGVAAFGADGTGEIRLVQGPGTSVRLMISTDADDRAEMVILLQGATPSAADFIL